MTRNQLLHTYTILLRDYRLLHSGIHRKAKKRDTGVKWYDDLNHVLSMLPTMAKMEDPDKFNRWLGFVQGFLWALDLRTIDDMRDDIRNLDFNPSLSKND